MFGSERLAHHAESLARAQRITHHPPKVLNLSVRLKQNASVLLQAYRDNSAALLAGQPVPLAAQWLLDNYHLVEEQLVQIKSDLPPGYYRQLPKIALGPFVGYPRVFELAWAYIAHTDSLISGQALRRFVLAYQSVQPLEIAELWALAITLRIVLVENMRRLSVQINLALQQRIAADALMNMASPSLPHDQGELPEIFAAQIAKRLRGCDPSETPMLGWLEERLQRQGTTLDDVVARAHARQGASNVTMRNIVTSMRTLSELDWADFFEDVSLVDKALSARSNFAEMDFSTRNQYRTAIEYLARGSRKSEMEVTCKALELAKVGGDARRCDPGHVLIGGGRGLLEAALGFTPSYHRRFAKQIGRAGLGGYIAAIGLSLVVLVFTAGWMLYAAGASTAQLAALAAVALFPASEAATALVNLCATRIVRPVPLPGMDMSGGVPTDYRTLVAVPLLSTGLDDLKANLERLEVHHLSSVGGAVHYALLCDGPDAATQTITADAELIAFATAGIARLNEVYPSAGGNRFLLLQRQRLWNEAEGCWMGWERKRGKLVELNRLLRGATDTSFLTTPIQVPLDVRFVITLDADTRLPRDAVRRMVGKMAHPLNRPSHEGGSGRVVEGYGILQPRVTASLPIGNEGSWFQQTISSPGGIEPYAAAISDVYQDLFLEGSFTGKGIYDVDAFQIAMKDLVPENTMLSHDLFEGTFARAALVSDIELVEDFPSRYNVAARRQHRWVRGDWQLLPWIFGQPSRGVSALGRWKMADNLRRSLVSPFVVLGLGIGWLMPMPLALLCTGLLLLMLCIGRLTQLPFDMLPGRAGITSRSHFAALSKDASNAIRQIGLDVVFLADTAWRMTDAIARTLWRLSVSRRDMLEWVTAAATAGHLRSGMPSYYRTMSGGVALGFATCVSVTLVNPDVWPLTLVFGLLWVGAPALASQISRLGTASSGVDVTQHQALALRLVARRTWRFFETFVTKDQNFLPPDNFQETPQPVIAHRTSPTNIGLYLLSTVAARDFGWIGTEAALCRVEQTLDTMKGMQHHRGHLYNWYNTKDLTVLHPAYVSSVDSGNLAGHLIAVAGACRHWQTNQLSIDQSRAGLDDTLALAQAALDECDGHDAQRSALAASFSRMEAAKIQDWPALANAMVDNALIVGGPRSELAAWTFALRDQIHDLLKPCAPDLVERLEVIALMARDMALAMDFAFLLDPDKKLLSIGFSAEANCLDPNCYDLLASEARLASLFAIAKGDIATRHWFRLGRSSTPLGAASALISWSGSMFEYLMPSLVMRGPMGSLLEQTNRLIVARQQAYGREMNVPWGISESSYNVRDIEMTYQYSNFGVPGLGLKRGLGENLVIAPYATGLAAMVDPAGAVSNYEALAAIGAQGRFGFYEALDFTASRLPIGEPVAIVRSVMAHHQGMTITSIANALQDGNLRQYFHADPLVQAVELLLQERVPRDVSVASPRAQEVMITARDPGTLPAVRQFNAPGSGPLTAHLLSNGRYAVMLTPTGAGYSQWGEIAVTRWLPDATRDPLGSYIFARDVASGLMWSTAAQAIAGSNGDDCTVFSEHQATFTHKTDKLTTTTEIVVSTEDDAEARRITLTNTGRHAREIDITSYAELVLAPAAQDLAHPAFSKLFVVTDHLPELDAIIATRRSRSPEDPKVWAAHMAVVEGSETAKPQIETDRARFIGRGRDIGHAAMLQASLSGTIGTVLDPVFAMRRRVLVPAGGMARITFWTLIAETSDQLLDLVDRHRDASAFERAVTLAWSKAQVQLRHLDITSAEAADFQRLGGFILRGDARLRMSTGRIMAGAGPQSDLWALGVSGDLPRVVIQIDDVEDIAQVQQLLAAHEYWRARQLAVDVIILNERASSYVQGLQETIDTAVRSSQSRPRSDDTMRSGKGTVYALRADTMTPKACALLLSSASVVLVAARGDISAHLDNLPEVHALPIGVPPLTDMTQTQLPYARPELEFFNGTGGFGSGGQEYVIVLEQGNSTPAPWVNVIANPDFGFQVSAEGSGYTWAENSRENQLTSWSNDPVCDPSGEAIYLRDLDTGAIWTPTALPMRGPGRYIAKHGFGYSRFEHEGHGIAASLVQFVPLDDPVKISRLSLTNNSSTTRRISVTAYAEWVMGTSRKVTAPYLITEIDNGSLFATNPWGTAFPGRVAFIDIGGEPSGWTGDRTSFLGLGGSMAAPLGLSQPLSNHVGAGLDPCAALQRIVELAAGETIELVILIGQTKDANAARALIDQLRSTDLDQIFEKVTGHWTDLLSAVQVKTPDRAMDIMLNGWLVYQTLACRIWARAGFYQASGAFGFRDQLQDGMALTFNRPEMTRDHLLRAAARQFPEGDVQHWWLPHSGQGVRTRISDDRVWLSFGVANYIAVSGDLDVLDEELPFIVGPALEKGAHDAFFQPQVSDDTASLFEHCARGLDQAIALTGEDGMPLIGTGDWNDGMNRVGENGKGTSVWLGWLLIATLDKMAPLADARDADRAAHWRAHSASLRAAIEAKGWDGEWYRRGTFDDGTPLGSAQSDECKIDSIAQSWAVLSGAAKPDRARQAMASLDKHLVRESPGLALLFTPPFVQTALDPGYIKGYPPGLRENGGQYSHAAMWAIFAHAKLGDGDRAQALFGLVNPINHALTAQDAARYKVEPYVVAADVYSTAPHEGRGGWTWYTGSAGWMHRAGIEGILGLTRRGDILVLNPCMPKTWPEVTMKVILDAFKLHISIDNHSGTGTGISSAELDGKEVLIADGALRLPITHGEHHLNLTLG